MMGVAVLSIRKDAPVPVSFYRSLLFSAWLGVLAPAAAADIYIWTDERGTTVISDTRPENPRALKNLEVVRDADRGTRKGSGPREATRTEQRLLDRIEELERQVRAQTYASPPPPAPAPAPSYAVVYSTTPPPPPAYDPYYTSGFYSPFPYVVPAPIVVRRSFGGHRHFHHRGRR